MVRFPWAFLVMAGLVNVNFEKKNVTATYRAELDKSRFLRQVAPMIFLGAIPRDGIDRNTTFRRTHCEFAAAMGYTWAESYTRNARKAPKLVERTMRQLVKGAVYRFAFEEGQQKYGANDFTMPSAKELRENTKWKEYWRAVRGEYSGYVQMPAWILDPRTPGTPYEKLVLIALASFGLFKLDASGHCKGEIQESLQKIGSRVGISKDAVRSALATYEDLKLLQVRKHPVRYELHGKVCGGYMLNGEPCNKDTAGAEWQAPPEGAQLRQPENTIFYVAGREFTQDKAEREMDRFLEAAKPWRDNPWFDVAAELHVAVLREWVGTRQLERTLHNECRQRLQKAGVPHKMTEDLFRRKPPD